MNLSDLFGGGVGVNSPITQSAAFSAAVTDSVVTTAPAILKYVLLNGGSGRFVTVKSGTAVVLNATGTGTQADCIPLKCGKAGIVCQNGITVSCSALISLNYILI